MLLLVILCFFIIIIFQIQCTEVTDKAFHEEWYHFGPSLKHTFLLMIIANNLGCKLSTFGNFNLSLPSLMTVKLNYVTNY